jgi:hypothetical protein
VSTDGPCITCNPSLAVCDDVEKKACDADPNCSAAQKCYDDSQCDQKPNGPNETTNGGAVRTQPTIRAAPRPRATTPEPSAQKRTLGYVPRFDPPLAQPAAICSGPATRPCAVECGHSWRVPYGNLPECVASCPPHGLGPRRQISPT